MAVGSNLNYQAKIDSLVAEVKALAGLQFPDGYVESVVEAYLEENHANLVTTEELNDAKYEILSDIQEDISGLLSSSGGTMTGELEMDNASILIDATDGTEASVEMTADASSSVKVLMNKGYNRTEIIPQKITLYNTDEEECWTQATIGSTAFVFTDYDDYRVEYSNYRIATNNQYIGIHVADNIIYYLDEDSFYNFPGNKDLGTSSRKWNNIYATNGTIQTSDRNEKENIADMTDEHSKAFIMGLNPVSYKMKNGTSGRTHYGLIAQEVEALLAELGISSSDFAGFIKSPKIVEEVDEKGKITRTEIEGKYNYALRYDEFIAPLIKVVQAQQTEIEELKTALNELKQK